jgi:hypothetical protein
MACVATRGLDQFVNSDHRRAARNEVERRAGVVRAQIEFGQVSRSVDADGVRGSGIESGGRFGLEDILILSGGELRGEAAAIGARLIGGGDYLAGGNPCGVGSVLSLIVRKHRRDEA